MALHTSAEESIAPFTTNVGSRPFISVCAIVVRTDEFGSLSSGRIMLTDNKVSARTTFGLSGASGWVAFNAITKVVLLVSSLIVLTFWTKSLCEHGNGSGEYLCNRRHYNYEVKFSSKQFAMRWLYKQHSPRALPMCKLHTHPHPHTHTHTHTRACTHTLTHVCQCIYPLLRTFVMLSILAQVDT